MKCTTCHEYFPQGGTTRGTFSAEFETLEFCGIDCLNAYRKTHECKPNRATSHRKSHETWITLKNGGRINERR